MSALRSYSPLDSDFDLFWELSTRKKDKGHARMAYRRAVRKAPKELIHQKYYEYGIETKDIDPRFIAYPATWLNGERWGDEADRPIPEVRDQRIAAARGALARAALGRG